MDADSEENLEDEDEEDDYNEDEEDKVYSFSNSGISLSFLILMSGAETGCKKKVGGNYNALLYI